MASIPVPVTRRGSALGGLIDILTTVDHKKIDAMKAAVVGRMEKESTALFATARLWDDGLIDPRDTRTLLGYLLDICHEADIRTLQPNSFGVSRF